MFIVFSIASAITKDNLVSLAFDVMTILMSCILIIPIAMAISRSYGLIYSITIVIVGFLIIFLINKFIKIVTHYIVRTISTNDRE